MAPSPRIAIANVRNNEVVPHSLVVLDGVIEDFVALALDPREWFIHASIDSVRGAFWPVNATGHFKATVLLPTPGKYTMTLRLQSHVTREIAIEYQPVESRYVVRFYYMKGSDASAYDGFDAPPGTNNSDEEAMQKIRFNALLLQTAMAEMFVHAGLPRKTFSLEYAADGLPQVHFLRTSFTTNEARTIHEQVLIRKIEEDIVAQGFNSHDVFKFKHEVILGCSTYNPATKGPIGHSALGGGMVGIFGSCGLHTWPKHLGELSACLLNNQRVDTNYLWDDSAYRGTFWANFSTGIGAFIHELGHTFGLGHSTSGIMARGFDDMNRLFCAFEADHARHEQAFYENYGDGRLLLNQNALKNVTGPDGAHWNIGSAFQLVHCPWVSGKPKESPCGPLVCWSYDKLGPVGWETNNDGAPKPFYTSPPKEPIVAIRIKAGTYVDDFTCYTRRQYTDLSEKKLRCRFGTHWVLLEDEVFTHVEVRAGAWIDGIRIFTNRQTTRWFGGFGGDLHVLRPSDGFIVSGFFGVRGTRYVVRLGVYCAPHSVPSIYQPSNIIVNFDPTTSQRVGGVDCSGGNSAESAMMTSGNQVGAIAVKCSKDYIERVRVVSCEVHERATKLTDSRVYEMDEQVFALRPSEFVQMVCVRSGKFIEALQFHTNQRVSLWYGGKGSSSSMIQELAPASDDIGVCGFSWRNGKDHKERLDMLSIYGAKCIFAEVAGPTSALILSLPRVGPVGEGKGDGQQRAILSAPSCGDLGAVCVEFGEYVSGVLACSILDLEKPEMQPHSGRQVFVLDAGEYITQVDVRCAWWVDGIQLHTNKRTSPHYGGIGGNLQVLRPPPGYKVQGVFGSKGDCFVGAIGLLCAPIDPASLDGARESHVAVPETFAMKSAKPSKIIPGAGIARGILIGVQDGVVQFVHSFDTDSMRQELLGELEAFASVGASVYSFTLHPGEWLLQIDANLDGVNDSVTGICLHTTTRCSSWFGTYDDDSIHFVAAPPGHVIKSVVGEASAAKLQDIVGEFALPESLPSTFAGVGFDEASRTAVKVVEDVGSYDIRLQSQSNYGIEAMFISKIRENEDLDQHAWRWKSTTPPPLRVCLPQRMLEHHIAPNQAGKPSKRVLYSGYALGAVDVGGAFTSSRSTV